MAWTTSASLGAGPRPRSHIRESTLLPMGSWRSPNAPLGRLLVADAGGIGRCHALHGWREDSGGAASVSAGCELTGITSGSTRDWCEELIDDQPDSHVRRVSRRVAARSGRVERQDGEQYTASSCA